MKILVAIFNLVNPYTLPALTPHWYVLQLVYPAISLVDIVILVILVIFIFVTIIELLVESIIMILYVNTTGTGTGGGNHDNSTVSLSVNWWDSEWGAPNERRDSVWMILIMVYLPKAAACTGSVAIKSSGVKQVWV